jgi:hypothetical protein
MATFSDKRRLVPRKLIWVLAAILLLVFILITINSQTKVINFGDSVQYWAAGRLALSGKNSYSAELVQELRNLVNSRPELPGEVPSMMLYPPWTLTLLLPFGIPSYQISRLLWFIFHILILFFCSNFIWRMYGGPKEKFWLVGVITFLFPPIIILLLMGHITSLHLLGLLGFLYFTDKPTTSKWTDFFAGVSAALVTIKPQLLFLFILAIIFWVVDNKRWWILIGIGLFIIIGTIIPLLFNPLVVSHYWNAMIDYPVGAWASPTIGMLLRLRFGIDNEWLQILPTLLGLAWLVIYWLHHKNTWDWKEQAPILILASIVTAAYMWTYDMVLLLLPVLHVAIISIRTGRTWARNLILFTYFLISIFVLVIHNYVNNFWFFWFPAFILIWYLVGRNLSYRRQLVSERT